MFRALRLAIFRAARVSRLLSELMAETEGAAGRGTCWAGDIRRGERLGTGVDWSLILTGFFEFILVVLEPKDELGFSTFLVFLDTRDELVFWRVLATGMSVTMESSGWRTSFNFLSISSASNCSTLMSLKGVISVSSPKDRLSYPPLKIPLALSNDRSM